MTGGRSKGTMLATSPRGLGSLGTSAVVRRNEENHAGRPFFKVYMLPSVLEISLSELT